MHVRAFEEVVSKMVTLLSGIHGPFSALLCSKMMVWRSFFYWEYTVRFQLRLLQDDNFARFKTTVSNRAWKWMVLTQKNTEGDILKPSFSKLGTCQGSYSFHLRLPNFVLKPMFSNVCGLSLEGERELPYTRVPLIHPT
jgi:hypothetical protein